MKGGIGSFTVTLPGGVLVSALVAVNALGDIRDPATGKIVAGLRKSAASREFADTEAEMLRGAVIGAAPRNTTLGVVATNARLTKVQATKLAQFASLGMARAIYPVNTMADGDIVFGLSLRPRRWSKPFCARSASPPRSVAFRRSAPPTGERPHAAGVWAQASRPSTVDTTSLGRKGFCTIRQRPAIGHSSQPVSQPVIRIKRVAGRCSASQRARKHGIEGLGRTKLHGVKPIGSGAHIVAGARKAQLEQSSDAALIINDQDAWGGIHRAWQETNAADGTAGKGCRFRAESIE
jgi:hypothetical protein